MSPREQILVREFELSDLESVKNLIKRTIDICYNGYYLREVLDYFEMYNWNGNILKVARDGHIVVAETQGEVVGTGSLINDVILRVFVDPTHHRQGLGRMVVNELERRAAANGVKVVHLRALANAMKFYESLGYLTSAKGLLEVDNGRHLEYYQMYKRLK